MTDMLKGITFYGTLGKFSWRMLATVLAGQAIVIFFGALVARAIAAAQQNGHDTKALWVGSGLAVLAFLAAGLMRRPFGVTLGWVVQVGTLVSALAVPMMLAIEFIFGGLWIYCLIKGAQIDREQAAVAASVGSDS